MIYKIQVVLKRVLVPGLTALLLVACQSALMVEEVPSSPYYMPPVGTLVIIDQELEVQGGWARAFLQRGEEVTYGTLDRYYPSCNFELTRVSELPQPIRPGRFTVTQVRRRDEQVVQQQPLMVASLAAVTPFSIESGLQLADTGVDAGPSMIMRTVRMKLHADDRPEMYMLTCRGGQDDPPEAEYVSIDEMRQALGDKARMVLPSEQ